MYLKSFLVLKAEIRSLVFLNIGQVRISDILVIPEYIAGYFKALKFVRKPSFFPLKFNF